ncbi:MAG: CPBP family intramembrane metalloprotease [Lactobacillaceae bacterium]|jgi:hypothetical protein|nr:CPBP family intramembrane metalloprotease [Lactobacillaceae bacterium]
MLSIQWLNYLIGVLAISPGMLIPLVKRIPILKRISSAGVYLSVLFILQVTDGINFLMLISLLLVGTIIPFCTESMIYQKKINLIWINTVIFRKFTFIFLFPLFEELNYRSLLMSICMKLSLFKWEFIIISSLAFAISHLAYQGRKSLVKSIQGIIFSSILVVTGQVLICILCHVFFNVLFFLKRSNQ